MFSDTPFLKERLAEAARYALMRRLLPAIRHNIAGTLQPIGMMSAMLERRVKAPVPDLVQLAKNAQALNTLSREAAATSLNLMNWLAPKDNHPVALGAAVGESLDLMATELSFRGFSIANETAALSVPLPKGVLRSVFTASLVALTDAFNGGAASVVVTADTRAGGLYLKITLQPGASLDTSGFDSCAKTYRSLDWNDVQALADAEGVSLSHEDGWVELRCPLSAQAV